MSAREALVQVVLGLSILAALPPAGAQAPSIEQLQLEIERRDALIEELTRRVEALEDRTASPSTGAPGRLSERRAEEAMLLRALERSLVRSGGELLNAGEKEVELSAQYEYTRRSGLAIVGAAVVFEDIVHKAYAATFGFRAGLPWGSQLELSIPYTRARVETTVAGASSTAVDSSFGDYELGFSKDLVHEASGRPGLIANVAWSDSRGSSSAVPGIFHDALHVSVTAVKRADPVVFVASAGRSFNRSADIDGVNVDPGDSNTAGVSAILAASPSVSLRAGFAAEWSSSNAVVNGAPIAGSRQTAATLELGGSVVFVRDMLLDLFIAVGLTDDSPDFTIGLSLPVRF